MKRGWRTSEFWMAALWTALAAYGVLSLYAVPSSLWPLALVRMPPVCLFVWFAGLASHNYGENRYRLKAQRWQSMAREPDKEPPADPGREFIFGSHVDSESETPDGEEEGGDGTGN